MVGKFVSLLDLAVFSNSYVSELPITCIVISYHSLDKVATYQLTQASGQPLTPIILTMKGHKVQSLNRS